MNIVTMQDAEFMRNGPIPIARESLAILQSRSNIPLGSLRRLSFLVKYLREYDKAIAWHRTVAMAAPWIPIPRTKMNIGSSIVLDMTVNKVSLIASRGLPEDRINALRPKYKWVMTLPRRITVIYSLA